MYSEENVMPYCQKCGNELPEGAKYCPVCGTAVAMEEAPAAPTVPTAPATPEASGQVGVLVGTLRCLVDRCHHHRGCGRYTGPV